MDPDDLTPRRDLDAERDIAEFLAGLPKDPAAMMAAFDQLSTAQEAELAANGIRPVSVVHGDIEGEEDAALIYGTDPARPGLHALAGQAGQYHRTQAGNDYTTWFFDGPDAEPAAVRFIAAVTAIARPWWVVTATAQPKFDR
jgi:hypothetical protein